MNKVQGLISMSLELSNSVSFCRSTVGIPTDEFPLKKCVTGATLCHGPRTECASGDTVGIGYHLACVLEKVGRTGPIFNPLASCFEHQLPAWLEEV